MRAINILCPCTEERWLRPGPRRNLLFRRNYMLNMAPLSGSHLHFGSPLRGKGRKRAIINVLRPSSNILVIS